MAFLKNLVSSFYEKLLASVFLAPKVFLNLKTSNFFFLNIQ